MKFRQLIENNVRNILFQNHAEDEVGRLDLDLFFFFKKALFKVKASVQHLCFNIIW